MLRENSKIILPGGAGLVGHNLVTRLKMQGFSRLVVLDKHAANLAILQKMHPDVVCECTDLAQDGAWQGHFSDAAAVVMLQAQIGGVAREDFVRNNLTASKNILDAVEKYHVLRLVHISSSVVESRAHDLYSTSKREQESMVMERGMVCPILRPTLMFGWFDRKHLGWLARFMQKVPVFPVPGHGRYMRQPLYAGDFCNIIIACLKNPDLNGVYNISGHEKIDYIDIIRAIKKTIGSKTPIVRIPYGLFHTLLAIWAVFDKDPPFTTQQLAALVTPDEFEIMDWPGVFGVPMTGFEDAIRETFQHPEYSQVALEF